jgi:hypothetical protein
MSPYHVSPFDSTLPQPICQGEVPDRFIDYLILILDLSEVENSKLAAVCLFDSGTFGLSLNSLSQKRLPHARQPQIAHG